MILNSKLRIIAILLVSVVTFLALTNFVMAADSLINPDDPCIKWGATPVVTKTGEVLYGTGNCGLCTFISIFTNASDVIIALAGAFSVVMFVYGGIVMITAYGTESRIKWGKDILIATTVGIFIIMLAWVLVNTVIWTMFGDNVASTAYNNITGKMLNNPDQANRWSYCNPELPPKPTP